MYKICRNTGKINLTRWIIPISFGCVFLPMLVAGWSCMIHESCHMHQCPATCICRKKTPKKEWNWVLVIQLKSIHSNGDHTAYTSSVDNLLCLRWEIWHFRLYIPMKTQIVYPGLLPNGLDTPCIVHLWVKFFWLSKIFWLSIFDVCACIST